MALHCEICAKKASIGNQITRRGKAKYLGGVGQKPTGITRRLFKPNLQNIRIVDSAGKIKHAQVCVKCIRSGAIKRPVKRDPFTMPKF